MNNDVVWQLQLSKNAFERGDHKVCKWVVEYDDGADGCMPRGWYLIGMRENGMPIYFPVRHEYGPFETEAEALGHIDSLDLTN